LHWNGSPVSIGSLWSSQEAAQGFELRNGPTQPAQNRLVDSTRAVANDVLPQVASAITASNLLLENRQKGAQSRCHVSSHPAENLTQSLGINDDGADGGAVEI
jgi:hypothetical protein